MSLWVFISCFWGNLDRNKVLWQFALPSFILHTKLDVPSLLHRLCTDFGTEEERRINGLTTESKRTWIGGSYGSRLWSKRRVLMGGQFLFFGLALQSDFEEKFAKKCKNMHEFSLNLLFFVKNTLVAIFFFWKIFGVFANN